MRRLRGWACGWLGWGAPGDITKCLRAHVVKSGTHKRLSENELKKTKLMLCSMGHMSRLSPSSPTTLRKLIRKTDGTDEQTEQKQKRQHHQLCVVFRFIARSQHLHVYRTCITTSSSQKTFFFKLSLNKQVTNTT